MFQKEKRKKGQNAYSEERNRHPDSGYLKSNKKDEFTEIHTGTQ